MFVMIFGVVWVEKVVVVVVREEVVLVTEIGILAVVGVGI
jgi:hypothetical protein